MNFGDSAEQSLQQLIELQRTEIAQNQQMLSAQQMNAQQQSFGAPGGNSYVPPMVSFAPQTQLQQQQFAGYAQQAGPGNNRYGFFDTMYINNSRVSNQSRQVMAADYGARLSNATMAGMGALGSTVADLGVSSMIPGFLGSMVAGTIAGGVVGGTMSIGLDQAKQSQAYNKYLLRESYRFINPLDSTNERDISGFNQSQRHEAANYLRHQNTQFNMKDEETMQLLQKFTEGGLLKDTKDLTDFKDRMKKLTQSVKEGALLLNETYGTIADMMSEMKKAGIADRNFDPLMSKSRVVGSMIGVSGTQALNDALNSSLNMNQGTEISNDTITSRVQSSLVYTDKRFSDLKNKKQSGKISSEELREYNAIVDSGGVEQMAPALVNFQNQILKANNGMMSKDAIAFFDYNDKENSFNFNRDKFNSFINGKTSLDDIAHQASTKLNSMSKVGQEKWMEKGQTYMLNSMDQDQMNNFDIRFLDSMKKMNPTYAKMNYEQLMHQLGIEDSPYRTAFAGSLDMYSTDKGQLSRQIGALSMRENILTKMNAKNSGFLGSIKNQWEKVKDEMGDPFQAVSDKMTDWTQSVQDWFYGKKYTKADMGEITKHDYSTAGINKQLSSTNEALSNAKKALSDLKGNGSYVDSGLEDALSGIQNYNNSRNDWRSKYIKEERTTFTSSKGLEDITIGNSNLGNEKEYKLLKDQSDKNNLSETIVAALMKYGQQNGKGGVMGMTSDMLAEASKTLGKKAYGAGDAGLTTGTDYLGKLMGLYGGNQNLAMSAFFSSQQDIDSQLRAAGVDINKLRNGGDLGSLQGLDWTKVVTNQDTKDAVNGANNSNTWNGANNDGKHYNVKGDPVKIESGKQYDVNYDYARGSKSGVYDDNQGVDVYDLIHYYAKDKGISPNAFATLAGVESHGRVTAGSPLGAQGMFQFMPGTFKNYVGREMTMPDGKKHTVTSDDINNPYVSAWAGADYYSYKLQRYDNNPYLAYAGYNSGSGDKIAGYLKQDYGMSSLTNATPQQIIDTIHRHFAAGGIGNVNGETDKAVARFSQIYNQGIVSATDTTITDKTGVNGVTTETRYVDGKTGKVLNKDEVSKLITDVMPDVQRYQYDPTALSNIHRSTTVKGNTAWFSENASSVDSLKNYHSTYQIEMEEYNKRIKELQGSINSDHSKEDTPVVGGIYGLKGKVDKNELDKLTENKRKLELDFSSNLGRVLNINRRDDESDAQYIHRVNSTTADEFQKNVGMLEKYYNSDSYDRADTEYGKMTTTQRGQILDFVQSIMKSGKADALGVSPTNEDVKKRILAGEAYVTDSDKAEYRSKTGKDNASYKDYLDAAEKSSWFTDSEAKVKDGKIYWGSTTKTDDLLKSIESQRKATSNEQLDAQDELIRKYQRTVGGTDSVFSPQDKEKIDGLIKNPGKSSISALDGMLQDYKIEYGKTDNTKEQNADIQKQMTAVSELADAMKEGFSKNTDALVEAEKALKDIKGTATGFSEVAKMMSDTLSQTDNQSDTIKDFIATLDRDSEALKKAMEQGPQQQMAALDKTKTDMANAVSEIIQKDRQQSSEDLQKMVEQLGVTGGVSDEQMKTLVGLVDKAEGKTVGKDGKATYEDNTGDKLKEQKEAQMKLLDEITGIIVGQTDDMNKTADANSEASTAAAKAGTDFAAAAKDLVTGVTTAISTLKKGVDEAKEAAGVANEKASFLNGFGLIQKIPTIGSGQ